MPAYFEIHQVEMRLPMRLRRGMSSERKLRTPTMTAVGDDVCAASSAGISPGSCCPSASMVSTASAPIFLAYANPDASAAPLPRLAGWRSTVAPAASAAAPDPSLEPSSTTITARAVARAPRTTSPTLLAP
jgi:hypothetical protein